MRQISIAASMPAVLAAALSAAAAPVSGQDTRARPPAFSTADSLAERLCQVAACEQLSAVIGLESGGFADRAGRDYLGGSGDDWRGEVARIHDPARVSALLLGRLEQSLTPALAADPRLQAALGATGVSADTDGRALELAARAELGRGDALNEAVARLLAERAQGRAVLPAIRSLIAAERMIGDRVAAGMNRQIGFARGFASAGGFDFPIALEDVAADLSLKLPELRAEAELQVELELFAAFAPLGVAAIDRIAAARRTAPSRLLQKLISEAEAEVLDQLAEETGRAAARRLRGTPL